MILFLTKAKTFLLSQGAILRANIISGMLLIIGGLNYWIYLSNPYPYP